MPRQLFAITRNTFLEAIRQPIFVVLILVAGLVLFYIVPSVSSYSMEPGEGDNRMLVDIGLGTLFLAGMALAAFTATGVVTSEMESRTALTVVSKPVSRATFVLGKFLGVAGAIIVAHYILTLILLFAIRHKVLQNASDRLDWPVILAVITAVVGGLAIAAGSNYLYRRVFTSTLTLLLAVFLTVGFALVTVIAPDWSFQHPGYEWAHDNGLMVELLIASALTLQGVLILTAFAVAVSTRLAQVGTILLCAVLLVLGLLAGWVSHRINLALGIAPGTPFFKSVSVINDSSESLPRKLALIVGKVLYLLAPNFRFHSPADAISIGNSLVEDKEGNFSLSYIGAVTTYSLCYITALLALGVAMFQKREVS